MPTPHHATYLDLRIALEDASLRLHELLDWAENPPPLSRLTWDRLMTMLEEMDLLVDRLDEEPEEVWRQAQESQVHATLDAIERPPT